MKTNDFIKMGKQLLPVLPGFLVEKKIIFKSPFEDFLHGMYFQSSSDADWFYVCVFFLPLFVPNDMVHATFGRRIGRDSNWDINNPSLMADLNAAIQNEAIPFLDKVETLPGILGYLKYNVNCDRPRVNSHVLEAYAYTLIKCGDYSSAVKSLAEVKERLARSTVSWDVQQCKRAHLIEEKLRQSPHAALTQLDAWKVETIGNLGLTKYQC